MSRISNINGKNSCRWSDTIIRRRKATGGDSDSSSSSHCDPAPPPPPPPPQQQEAADQRGCLCHKNGQESFQQHGGYWLIPRHPNSRRGSRHSYTVEKLTMKICDYKGQELEYVEHYNYLNMWLQRMRSALNFVVHYAKCLELHQNANTQLHRLASSMIVNPSERLAKLLDLAGQNTDISILKNVLEQASFGLEECSRLRGMKSELNTKASDFHLATCNFNLLLTNLKVLSSQLRKIEPQYDDIFLSYKQSRTSLEREMTKLISSLKEVLSQSFKGLSNWLQLLGQSCSHLVELFSCLEEELNTPLCYPSRSSVSTSTEPIDVDPSEKCGCSLCPEHRKCKPG